MSEQKNLNVEMKFTFSIPFDEFELDEEVLVTFPLSSGKFVDTYVDTWLEFEIGVGFENTENDVIYWMEMPQYNGELDD